VATRALVNDGTRRSRGHITSLVLQPPLLSDDLPFLLNSWLNVLGLVLSFVFSFVFSFVSTTGTFLTQV
jgi:hypothetical protein